METQSAVPLVSLRRALLTCCLAALMLAFNYGSTVDTASDAALAVAVFLVVGYPALTATELFLERVLWRR